METAVVVREVWTEFVAVGSKHLFVAGGMLWIIILIYLLGPAYFAFSA